MTNNTLTEPSLILSDFAIEEIARRSQACKDQREGKNFFFDRLEFLADPYFFDSVNKICAELLKLRGKKTNE